MVQISHHHPSPQTFQSKIHNPPSQRIMLHTPTVIPDVPNIFDLEKIKYINELPTFIQSHVSRVYNIKADGHCGFCVAEYAMGRGEDVHMDIRSALHQEITKRKAFYIKQGVMPNIQSTLDRIYPTPSAK
ncbi:hypothetical protein VP01_9588g1, partial [Puccinia sorghi]